MTERDTSNYHTGVIQKDSRARTTAKRVRKTAKQAGEGQEKETVYSVKRDL